MEVESLPHQFQPRRTELLRNQPASLGGLETSKPCHEAPLIGLPETLRHHGLRLISILAKVNDSVPEYSVLRTSLPIAWQTTCYYWSALLLIILLSI